MDRERDALNSYQTASALDHGDADAYFVLGFAYLRLGRDQDAISQLEAGLLLAPDREGPRSTLEKLLQGG